MAIYFVQLIKFSHKLKLNVVFWKPSVCSSISVKWEKWRARGGELGVGQTSHWADTSEYNWSVVQYNLGQFGTSNKERDSV